MRLGPHSLTIFTSSKSATPPFGEKHLFDMRTGQRRTRATDLLGKARHHVHAQRYPPCCTLCSPRFGSGRLTFVISKVSQHELGLHLTPEFGIMDGTGLIWW